MIPRLVQSLAVSPDGGLQITYLTPTEDVKTNGIVHLHTLIVPPNDEYDDEIEEITVAIKHLIGDVLDDMPHLPAGDPE